MEPTSHPFLPSTYLWLNVSIAFEVRFTMILWFFSILPGSSSVNKDLIQIIEINQNPQKTLLISEIILNSSSYILSQQ